MQIGTNQTAQAHPLRQTLARAAAGESNFYADVGALENDWFPASDLLNEADGALETALARQAVYHPDMEPRTRGSYLVGEYSWFVPMIAIHAYLAEQRVPDLSLDNVALRYSKYIWHEGEHSGEAERTDVRFLSGRFAALADDPAAHHPDALIVPDRHALREWMRTTLEAHLTPMIERIYTQTRLGRHAQWCLVADACAALFLNVGRALGDEAYGISEGQAFVKAEGSPMKNPNTDYVSLNYLEHRQIFRARGGCCRYYTVTETGKDYCTTCVLRKPEDRDARLLAYMKRKYGEAAS